MSSSQDNPPQGRKRDEHLSKDGKWRSFPRVPRLLQYASNGHYYGRIKLNGKVIRESLETAVWTTAKLKLADFLKEQLDGGARPSSCNMRRILLEALEPPNIGPAFK
jgi:hypothetical protein